MHPFTHWRISISPLELQYLGIILDRKLSWQPNVEERVRKALVALCCFEDAIGKRWSLSQKVLLWLYQTVVKPILFYGASVWWRAFGKVSSAKLDTLKVPERDILKSSVTSTASLITWTTAPRKLLLTSSSPPSYLTEMSVEVELLEKRRTKLFCNSNERLES